MTLRPHRFALLAVLAAVTAGCVGNASGARPAGVDRRAIRELDMAFYTQRAARDPIGATDRLRLATLYLDRARETGSVADLERADSLAALSLSLRQSHNAAASVVRASALMAQHKFLDALDVARALDAKVPDVPAYRGLLGEIELELGMYDSARALFAALPERRSLAVAPRYARFAEITGHPEEAEAVLREALVTAASTPRMPREQLAWFYLRVGEISERNGRPNDAADAFVAGLRVNPDDYRLLSAQAKLAGAQHRWRAAVDAGERALASALDPGTLGVLSDAYAALGDTAKSNEYIRVMEVALLHQRTPLHRAWSLFLLDHDRDVPQVLARVQDELATRHDVYGYDLLAWALHRSGRDAEAADAMRKALAQGTRDPLLLRHAAEIERGR